MPVFSKIASPTLADGEYYASSPGEHHYKLSLSPTPARSSRQNLFEGDPTPHYNTVFASARHARFSGSGSGQAARNPAVVRPLRNPPPSQHSRSHISISSDDPDTDATELLILRNNNIELKLEVQRLRGRIEAMSYVPVIPIIFTY